MQTVEITYGNMKRESSVWMVEWESGPIIRAVVVQDVKFQWSLDLETLILGTLDVAKRTRQQNSFCKVPKP